ncbi:3-coathanger stack domain-containing protein [Jiulongibacter sediminis]|jgi:hypothetical protein|uniref:3-coathanger stack domain-containing protein n=1 Tax=Jiulongibacter sediminis TaxID=1605367 RepID=UPI0026E9D3CA|nr:3-coathanger stack domain-containing protein [Jiulongibacter sediminis]
MKKLIATALISFCSMVSIAQITVSFPMERQVFQRTGFNHTTNFQGDGVIQIAGNFESEYDSIMAMVEPRVVGQGTATSWQKIHTRNGKPYFKGSLSAKGGWYKLYVQSWNNGAITDTDTVQRVGIGEVFAIAGQSNAQGGDEAVAGPVALDDRVIAINYDNDTTTFNKLAIGFSKIDDDSSSIGSFHYVPWNWARLGDILADSLNVPILFYGTAHGGTSVIWWKQAALGEPLTGAPSYVREEIGAPYQALKVVLNFYISLTGLRAIIWHQGETDRFITPGNYRDNLNAIITESRTDSENASLAWLVCRVSYTGGQTYNGPWEGQNLVIDGDPNVFAGPDTDVLTSGTGHRETVQNVHFNYPGLFEFSRLLEIQINSTFLQNSTPCTAEEFMDVNFSCTPSNSPYTLSLTSALTSPNHKYAWSNRDNTDLEARGKSHSANYEFINYPPADYLRLNWEFDSTSSIMVGAGRYALNVIKPTSEKILFSPIIDLTSLTLPTNPSFTASATQVRPGDTLTLTGSNCNGTYLWSTTETGSSLLLTPASTASYTLACKTLHCQSNSTAPTEVVVSSCFSNPLSLTGNVNGTEAPYQSQQTIQSTQMVNQPSGNIQYTAVKSVLLNPGFKAENGALFQASISDCP